MGRPEYGFRDMDGDEEEGGQTKKKGVKEEGGQIFIVDKNRDKGR